MPIQAVMDAPEGRMPRARADIVCLCCQLECEWWGVGSAGGGLEVGSVRCSLCIGEARAEGPTALMVTLVADILGPREEQRRLDACHENWRRMCIGRRG